MWVNDNAQIPIPVEIPGLSIGICTFIRFSFERGPKIVG